MANDKTTTITSAEEEERRNLYAKEPSKLAVAIENLKRSCVSAADKREHLPQPLYWSLFNAELARIKKIKAKRDLIESVLGDKLL